MKTGGFGSTCFECSAIYKQLTVIHITNSYSIIPNLRLFSSSLQQLNNQSLPLQAPILLHSFMPRYQSLIPPLASDSSILIYRSDICDPFLIWFLNKTFESVTDFGDFAGKMLRPPETMEEQLIIQAITEECPWENLPKRLQSTLNSKEDWHRRFDLLMCFGFTGAIDLFVLIYVDFVCIS